MEKTITITEGEYRHLVAQTTAEIMAENGDSTPGAALLFSLSCVAFSAALARKLFPENEDDKKASTESNKKAPTESNVGHMREELTDFCNKRHCDDCPMNKRGFECGRGKTFSVPMGDSGYMTDESIIMHYTAMKGAES